MGVGVGSTSTSIREARMQGAPSLVMSPLLILITLKSLLWHLPHMATLHLTQPLSDLAPASLVSTAGCRPGHLVQNSARLPATFSFPQEGPPEPSTAWPHSPQYLPPTATQGCYVQNVLLPGRQTIPYPDEELNPYCVMGFSKQDFLFTNSPSWGPDPKDSHPVLTLTPRHS